MGKSLSKFVMSGDPVQFRKRYNGIILGYKSNKTLVVAMGDNGIIWHYIGIQK